VVFNAPEVLNLAEVVTPPVLVFAFGTGLLVAWLVLREFEWSGAPIATPAICLMVALALWPATMAFVISVLTSTRIFSDRYVIGSFVGVALMAGWVIGRIQPAAARSLILLSIISVSVVAFGHPRHLWPEHFTEDWRGAVAAVNKAVGQTQTPVILKAVFVETQSQDLNVEEKIPGWVKAPFVYYPVKGRIFTVRKFPDARDLPHVEGAIAPAIDGAGRFILMSNGLRDDIAAWMPRKYETYAVRSLGNFGTVTATLYERR
jgi:hypothetical protein